MRKININVLTDKSSNISFLLETVPLSNGLTGHIIKSKEDLFYILSCTSNLYENLKKKRLNQKSKEYLIDGPNNEIHSSIFIQISFLPFCFNEFQSKRIKNFQTFIFMDLIYEYNEYGSIM